MGRKKDRKQQAALGAGGRRVRLDLWADQPAEDAPQGDPASTNGGPEAGLAKGGSEQLNGRPPSQQGPGEQSDLLELLGQYSDESEEDNQIEPPAREIQGTSKEKVVDKVLDFLAELETSGLLQSPDQTASAGPTEQPGKPLQLEKEQPDSQLESPSGTTPPRQEEGVSSADRKTEDEGNLETKLETLQGGDDLDPDWQPVLDPGGTGEYYYWNVQTGETSWVKPLRKRPAASQEKSSPLQEEPTGDGPSSERAESDSNTSSEGTKAVHKRKRSGSDAGTPLAKADISCDTKSIEALGGVTEGSQRGGAVSWRQRRPAGREKMVQESPSVREMVTEEMVQAHRDTMEEQPVEEEKQEGVKANDNVDAVAVVKDAAAFEELLREQSSLESLTLSPLVRLAIEMEVRLRDCQAMLLSGLANTAFWEHTQSTLSLAKKQFQELGNKDKAKPHTEEVHEQTLGVASDEQNNQDANQQETEQSLETPKQKTIAKQEEPQAVGPIAGMGLVAYSDGEIEDGVIPETRNPEEASQEEGEVSDEMEVDDLPEQEQGAAEPGMPSLPAVTPSVAPLLPTAAPPVTPLFPVAPAQVTAVAPLFSLPPSQSAAPLFPVAQMPLFPHQATTEDWQAPPPPPETPPPLLNSEDMEMLPPPPPEEDAPPGEYPSTADVYPVPSLDYQGYQGAYTAETYPYGYYAQPGEMPSAKVITAQAQLSSQQDGLGGGAGVVVSAAAHVPEPAPKKVKKKKAPVTLLPVGRSSGKKVSSMLDKWRAAKEELQDKEPEDAGDPEALQKKKERELEEWRMQQLASGEAAANPNFAPLGGDWRERVAKARKRSSKESAAEAASQRAEGTPEPKPAASGKPNLEALSKGLPQGWQAFWDSASREVYYGNVTTSKTSWERPRS